MTISLLQRAMDESGSTKPFLIDGFPRNEENRSQFEKQVGPLSLLASLARLRTWRCRRGKVQAVPARQQGRAVVSLHDVGPSGTSNCSCARK